MDVSEGVGPNCVHVNVVYSTSLSLLYQKMLIYLVFALFCSFVLSCQNTLYICKY